MHLCEDIVLEIFATTDEWFNLDVDLLDDPTAILAPEQDYNYAGYFVLDESDLDGPDLLEGFFDAPDNGRWVDFTSSTMNIEVNRGLDVRQSVIAMPRAGIMDAVVQDPYFDALRNQNVGPKAPIRLRMGTVPVFVGEVISLRTEYTADDVPIVYISAADAVGILNSTMIAIRGAETFQERVSAIMQETGLLGTVSGTGTTMAATDKPYTALELLELTLNAEAGMAWVGRDNTLTALTAEDSIPIDSAYYPGTPPDALWLFSNDHSIPDHHCLTGLASGEDTAQVINNITYRNIEPETDPDTGEVTYTQKDYVEVEPTSSGYYGVGNLQLEVAVDPLTIGPRANHIFTYFSEPRKRVQNLEYITSDYHGDEHGSDEIVKIDVGDPVQTYIQHPKYADDTYLNTTQRVMAISHLISPERWVTQLSLY